jgi:hypothetical protein
VSAPLRRSLLRIAVGVGFILIAAVWLGRGENRIVGYCLLVVGILLLAIGAYEIGWELRGRRSAVALSTLALLGAAAFLAIDRPWASVSSAQAARALEHRLSSASGARALGLGHTITDRYVCVHTVGSPPPGEPAWTYLCSDAIHSRETGFFVLTRGDGIAKIEGAG